MTRTMCAGLTLALVATQALAEPAQSATPGTLLLPTKTIIALRQYLGSRPYDETAGLISSLDACARVQMSAGGVSRPVECPEVAAALRTFEDARSKSEAPTTAPADALGK